VVGVDASAVPLQRVPTFPPAYADTIAATIGIQVLGRPTGAVTEMLQRQAGARVPWSIRPYRLGGFTR
jgi:hypothetical protein